MGIADRRHEEQKRKSKAKRLGDKFSKLYNNLTSCSCWTCGNPRKWHKKKTIKETLHEDWKRLESDWSKFT